MTESNLERLRRGFADLARSGFEAMVPLIHPDFEMETPADLAAEPQRYGGPDGYRRWWTSFYEVMDEVRLEPAQFVELSPDHVAIDLVIRAKGQTSGIEASQEAVLLADLDEGLMRRIRFFATVEEARAAANVDRVREGFVDLAELGYETIVPRVHEDFEMETPAALAAEPQRYEGREGFRR